MRYMTLTRKLELETYHTHLVPIVLILHTSAIIIQHH